MNDHAEVALLQRVLPRLHLRWAGFRRVRRQVLRKVRRRLRELGLSLEDYAHRLETDPAELALLDEFCRITISRFYRDRGFYDRIRREVFPGLAPRGKVRVLSAGCASGEEPYTIAIIWNLEVAPRFPGSTLEVIALDASPTMLERARAAVYESGAIAELPSELRDRAFGSKKTGEKGKREERENGDFFELREEHRRPVTFLEADLRGELPPGPFDLVLCRNLAFTYFDEALQREVAGRLAALLRDGWLVVGAHERIPDGVPGIRRVRQGWYSSTSASGAPTSAGSDPPIA